MLESMFQIVMRCVKMQRADILYIIVKLKIAGIIYPMIRYLVAGRSI